MVETLCTSGAVKLKAGTNVSSSLTATDYTMLINQAESHINAKTRINWTDNYADLDDDLRRILEDAASSHAALGAINFDMSVYTSRAEAQTMLDLNYTRFTDAMAIIKEKVATDFIQGV